MLIQVQVEPLDGSDDIQTSQVELRNNLSIGHRVHGNIVLKIVFFNEWFMIN